MTRFYKFKKYELESIIGVLILFSLIYYFFFSKKENKTKKPLFDAEKLKQDIYGVPTKK